jgi:hypothetical protein
VPLSLRLIVFFQYSLARHLHLPFAELKVEWREVQIARTTKHKVKTNNEAFFSSGNFIGVLAFGSINTGLYLTRNCIVNMKRLKQEKN